ncbi:Ras GTPase-activating-like protein rgaA [Balamuthia mandrillaris]
MSAPSKSKSSKSRSGKDSATASGKRKAEHGKEKEKKSSGGSSSASASKPVAPPVPAEAIVQTSVVDWEADPEAALLAKQTDCQLLLLEARVLLAKMVRWKFLKEQKALELWRTEKNEDRKRRGKLSVTEIQEVLQSQPEGEDGDWISEIQELKRQLVIEIRRNHVLDRDLQKLDKRIGLLIKNRTTLMDVLEGMEKKKKKKKKGQEGEEREVFDLKKDPRKLEYYQELFYLLQTEPRYLAKCVYRVQPEQMDSFLDTTILTLYGDAFSPREEFLILKLFQLAIKNEISNIKALSDFLKANTVVPKMVITYNRRKLGLEYLKTTLGPLLKTVMEKADLNLELHPLLIYQNMINEMEIRTGEKSSLERNIPEEKAMANQQVKTIMKQRLTALRDICQVFLDGVINSMGNLPYGIRWICKQIKNLSIERFGEALDNDQVLKVTGYFVYYRFINLAIVTPDAYNVVDSELDPVVRKNLVVVGKVLQNLFNFRLFNKQEKYMMPLNSFIEKNKPVVEHYFNSLVKVDEPEDYLQVNKYMELTQKTKPLIQISLHEISSVHNLLLDNLDSLAPDKDDDLRVILKDLGEAPPEIDDLDDREIQLTLTSNRFKVEVEEEDEVERMYAETKELIIPVLRTIPIETSIHRLHLTDVLESGIRFAGETNNKQLSNQINKILENIAKLEKEGRLSKSDRYESFVHDISLEVANRAAIREQQKREIERLTATLANLRKHQAYVNDQIAQYQEVLQQCREKHYQPKKAKKKKKKGADDKTIVGPFKFSYKDLAKKGVIVDSEVPAISRKKTQFIISSEEVGMFDIVAKIAGISVEKMTLELDDLLERHYNGVEYLELEQVTLDVNMTIFLINKFFLGKK